MRKFYITSIIGNSGINKYSRDFFDLVVSPLGFILLDTHNWSLKEILKKIYLDDRVHIEIGLNQKMEAEILISLLKINHKYISITSHDSPRIKYPYFQFKSSLLNKLSKVIDLYFDNFGINKNLLRKVDSIFVLNQIAKKILENKFQLTNVAYLPFVINPKEVIRNEVLDNSNLIFFGFLGKNKGLEVALKFHARILKQQPNSHFYIIGGALDHKVKTYVNSLKRKYIKNVSFLGFVPNSELKEIFEKANYVILPYKENRFIYPTNASVLSSLCFSKIVFTTPVNSIPEFILDGINGFFLKENFDDSILSILSLMKDKKRLDLIKDYISNDLLKRFSPYIVQERFVQVLQNVQ